MGDGSMRALQAAEVKWELEALHEQIAMSAEVSKQACDVSWRHLSARRPSQPPASSECLKW